MKTMTILPALAFAIGFIGIVSFTQKEKSPHGTTWYYTDGDGRPDFSSPVGSDGPRCIGAVTYCATEVHNGSGLPTGNYVYGMRL